MPHYTTSPIKLLIADDHEVLRDGFHIMLKKHKEINLVAEASNGEELVALAEKHQPDVIIADIKMPKMDGIQATKVLTEKFPHIGIIAFTMYDEESLIIDMLEAGAQGYLTKSAGKNEILEAIQSVMNGKVYYCKNTTARLTKLIAASKFNPRKKIPQQAFSPREKEIITLICQEKSNKEIASELNLSIRTIEGHRENIQDKMQVKNTAGIVVYAIRKGLFKL